VVNVDMSDIEYRLQGHSIGLVGGQESGWGYVALPTDANLRDNRYYFAFGNPPERRAIIVAEEPGIARPLRLALTAPVDPDLSYGADVVSASQFEQLDLATASLVLWQAPLPEATVAQQLLEFVQSGRPVIFLPPRHVSPTRWSGMGWTGWESAEGEEPLKVRTWRGESDLLRHGQSGVPLPVGKLAIYRHCGIEGEGSSLAELNNRASLLRRGTLGQGAFYFCATWPTAGESSLLRDGVTLYVMLHRALEMGANSLSRVRQLDAGTEEALDVAQWELLSEQPAGSLSTDRPFLAGVFRHEDRLVALNRPAAEDRGRPINEQQVDQLFEGLAFRVVAEELGSTSALASEIWRVFVLLMALALITEAVLCLPERKLVEPATATQRQGVAAAATQDMKRAMG